MDHSIKKTEGLGEKLGGSVRKRLRDYYELRTQAGKANGLDNDEMIQEEGFEILEGKSVDELNNVQQAIVKVLNAAGFSYDPNTGDISRVNATGTKPKEELIREIDSQMERLTVESKKYEDISNALNGDENDTEKKPGVRQRIIERTQELVKRDVDAKRVLAARSKIEAKKDEMDMSAARHIVQRNKYIMKLEEAKLGYSREILKGTSPNSPVLTKYRLEIEGYTKAIEKCDVEFSNLRTIANNELEACRIELEKSQKELVLPEERSGGANKCKQNLLYSEDGILNGSEAEIRMDDRTASEKELFDDRGIMVFDIADILQREKSINIDGVTITCVTEFHGQNIEDSYYVGDMEMLETNIYNGGQTSADQKPDIEDLKNDNPIDDGEETNKNNFAEPPRINRRRRMTKLLVNGILYSELGQVPPEFRYAVIKGVENMGFEIDDMLLVGGYKSLTLAIKEKIREIQKDMDIEGEIIPPPPYQNS